MEKKTTKGFDRLEKREALKLAGGACLGYTLPGVTIIVDRKTKKKTTETDKSGPGDDVS